MRPLRPSDSGMTAVLAIRQHAAVLELKEARHHGHHHGHSLDRREGFEASPKALAKTNVPPLITRNDSLVALKMFWETEGGTSDDARDSAHNVPEGEGHATLADR